MIFYGRALQREIFAFGLGSMKGEAVKLSHHGLVATPESRPLALVINPDEKYASLHSAEIDIYYLKGRFLSASIVISILGFEYL